MASIQDFLSDRIQLNLVYLALNYIKEGLTDSTDMDVAGEGEDPQEP